MIGKTLSQYEVQSLLGVGGMGEVYLARDTKLGRSVAVKVLLDAVASHADRIARFEREAKLLASLNHPNIAALYGMEQADGKHFLVMELIEGETIAERLRRGPMPVEEAIGIARQISEALEAAHEKGVVHRDLKPANIKINPSDVVKVLDFGLAKVMENAPANANVSNSPTLSMAATQAGVILGTAAYMSPEQAKGFPADARSDVFSFGCVLYEMLVGRQPFQGDTSAEVLASVLVRDVDLNALPPNLNPRIREVLRRCLEKSPKRRWHAVADLRAELDSIAEAPRVVATAVEAAAIPRPLWKRAIPAVIAAIVFSALGVVGERMLNRPAPGAIIRYPLVLPEGQTFSFMSRQMLAISPDGLNLAYLANVQIFVRSMADMEAHPISMASAQVSTPFFSPDGKWIGFWSALDSSLKKIAITGGAPLMICKAELPFGATWSGDQIVFSQGSNGIFRVSENGGNPELLVKPQGNETYDNPQLLNDGRDILYSSATETGLDRWDKGQIIVQSLQSAERKVLIRGGSAARYIPTGHLVYALAGNLLAIPFDATTKELRGGPVPMVEGVARGNAPATSTGAAQFAFSDDGLFAYVVGSAGNQPQNLALAFADREGKLQPIDLPPQNYIHPRISPDGNQIAVATDDGKESTVWIYDRKSGGPLRRLTFAGRNAYPIWTPDGRYVTFQSDRDGDRAMFKQAADGSGSAERISKPADTNTAHEPESWNRDGRTLSFDFIRGGDQGIFTVDSADGKPKELYDPKSTVQKHSSFSADGRWIAYMSTELNAASGGVPDVFVQPYPPTGAKYQISSNGGRTPAWSSDGKQLFYHVTNTNQIMVVDVRTQPSFSIGKAVALPISGTVHPQQQRNYDVTPDGKQLLVVLPASGVRDPNRRPTQQINFVLNWFEDLKQRAPPK